MSVSAMGKENECFSTTEQMGLEIRISTINGKGLFTRSDIAVGKIIYESKKYDISSAPVFGSIQRTSSEHLLDGTLRWLNHSCEPNCELRFEGHVVRLCSTRVVQGGSELLCDYRKTEWQIPEPFICNCSYCNGRQIS